MTANLSERAALLLKNLRSNHEGEYSVDALGRAWFSVYLDNATEGFPRRVYPGLLAALAAAGHYVPVDGYAWGEVLGTPEMIAKYDERPIRPTR